LDAARYGLFVRRARGMDSRKSSRGSARNPLNLMISLATPEIGSAGVFNQLFQAILIDSTISASINCFGPNLHLNQLRRCRFSPIRSMSSRSVYISQSFRAIALAALLLPCFCGSTLSSQAPPASGGMSDPTRPEIQPGLTTDRDPIPSPDLPEPPVNAASPSAPALSGDIQRQKDGVFTLHQDVDEVLLSCAVVDEKGRAVMDLHRGDFRIFEDGAPQATSSFVHQDVPLSMGILLDDSGSMRDKREAVNAAALKLLRASNPQDTAFIVNFSDRAYLDQGFTSDLVALNRGLSRIDSRGTTALYDAVAASANELSKHAKQPKQALLIITDGADNASRLSLQDAIRRVQSLGGPVVYTIGLLYDDDKPEAERARDALERLSEQTGGIAYFPSSLDQVDTIAGEVAQDIRNQYTVGYHSDKPVSLGGFRRVRVEARAANHGKLTVRTRTGYYAKHVAPAQQALGSPK
jgi:Ca-activated chloride channel family protein